MENAEFETRIRHIVDRFRSEFVGVDPEWGPLEALLPAEWCDGFMFMGRAGPDDSILLYKHGITRRYLNLDHEGRCWTYQDGDYVPIDTVTAVMQVYAGLEKMNATPDTKYDAAFIATRNTALAAAGYTVIG